METAEAEAAAVTALLAKCTKPCAATAERNAKFLSSRRKESLCTAGIASRSTRNRAETATAAEAAVTAVAAAGTKQLNSLAIAEVVK